ncbi:hypothetical protein B0H11DRAFT_2254840 [Mycena galericulata]|nr:hypothetical protein B0H11DRAFT_2254840 [Mycena galericulata]
MGFEEGRQSGFEEGRRTGEKDALSMDAFEVSFAAGKMAGIATGMEQGREVETQRWKDIGHFEDGTCRAFGSATIVDSSPQPQPLPLDDDAASRFFRPSHWLDEPIRHIATATRAASWSKNLETSTTTPAVFPEALHKFLGLYPASASDSVRLQFVGATIIISDLCVDMDPVVWVSAGAHFSGLQESSVGNEDVALWRGADAVPHCTLLHPCIATLRDSSGDPRESIQSDYPTDSGSILTAILRRFLELF